MKLYTTLLIISSLFFAGCINLQKNKATPKEKKQTHILKLNNEVRELDTHDKRLIYKSIKHEIQIHRNKGNSDYKYEYYFDAINAYELVNFYEGYPAIGLRKIAYMRKIAKERSIKHYKIAKKYLTTNKKTALRELNIVMMNNPKYKDTTSLYSAIKSDRDIKIFINSLENLLETKLVNNNGSYKDLKSIQYNLKKLAKYDYKNRSVTRARELLNEKETKLLHSAVAIYKQGKLNTAKQKFLEILSIYPDNASAQKYMKKIDFKQSKKHNLYLAKQALKHNKYLKSIAYSKKVLQLEANNTQAKNIIISANKKSKREVKRLVYEGKRYYNSKNLDKAKQSFEQALKIDKTNNSALIYSKKIQRQLQTIKSLQ